MTANVRKFNQHPRIDLHNHRLVRISLHNLYLNRRISLINLNKHRWISLHTRGFVRISLPNRALFRRRIKPYNRGLVQIILPNLKPHRRITMHRHERQVLYRILHLLDLAVALVLLAVKHPSAVPMQPYPISILPTKQFCRCIFSSHDVSVSIMNAVRVHRRS